MKTKNRRFLFDFLLISFFLVATLNSNAQVTIGLKEEPEKGSLLQLKNIENAPLEGANANKGLLLPRVKLVDIRQLEPMFPRGYNKEEQDKKHTGLLVYNMNENLYDGDGQGVYMWDGEKWFGMGMVKRKISVNPLNVYIYKYKYTEDGVEKVRERTASAQVSTVPLNFPFEHSVSGKNSSSFKKEDGKYTFTINEAEPNVSGNQYYKFTLGNSSRSVTVAVNHLKLNLGKEIVKVGKGGSVATSAVEVDGGDAKWIVKDYSKDVFNWVVAPYNDGENNLRFQLGEVRAPNTVKGYIDVAHINDPTYVRRLQVWQDSSYIQLPEFDYLVVEYYYTKEEGKSVDLDTATEINNTKLSGIDHKAVGYGLGSTQKYDGITFLTFAGDNRSGGYEAVYTNMTELKSIIPDSSPRELNVDMYATWWSPTSYKDNAAKNKIRIRIKLYRGGTMHIEDYNFYNMKDGVRQEPVEGGIIERTNLLVNSGVNSPSLYATDFAKLLRLEYDRKDETGLLMRLTDIPQTQSMPMMTKSAYSSTDDEIREEIRSFKMLPNESKDDFAIRYNKFVEEVYKKYNK